MTTLSFDQLRITQFKSISSLTFDFTFYNAGCYSIKGRNELYPRMGSNAVGKTSMWDALCYALYGKTPRGLRSPDVVPWDDAKSNPRVTLDLSIDDKQHTISREANPHKIKLDDKVVVQERIDDLIRLPYDVFLYTACFAQSKPLFLDQSPRDKLALISDVLKLDRFDEYADKAVDAIKAIDFAQSDLDAEQRVSVSRERDLSEDIKRWTSLVKSFEADKRAKIAQTQHEIAALRTAISTLSKEHDDWVIKEGGTEIQEQRAESSIAEWEAELRAMQDVLAERRQAHAQMEVLRSGTCSVCGQPISPSHKAKHIKQLQAVIANMPDIKAQMAKVDRGKQQQREIRDKRREYSNKVSAIDSAIKHAKQEYVKAQANLKLHTASKNPHQEQINNLTVRLTNLRKEIDDKAQQIEQLSASKAKHLVWPDAFKQMRLSLVDELMSTLSLLTTAYTSELGFEVTATFDVERETKAGTVVKGINCAVEAAKFEAMSGGEGQRLRIAASLAFSQTLLEALDIEIKQMIFDEPSAHLSPNGLNELTAFLSNYARQSNRSIFVTDQRPLANVDSSMTIVRTANETILVP